MNVYFVMKGSESHPQNSVARCAIDTKVHALHSSIWIWIHMYPYGYMDT